MAHGNHSIQKSGPALEKFADRSYNTNLKSLYAASISLELLIVALLMIVADSGAWKKFTIFCQEQTINEAHLTVIFLKRAILKL